MKLYIESENQFMNDSQSQLDCAEKAEREKIGYKYENQQFQYRIIYSCEYLTCFCFKLDELS